MLQNSELPKESYNLRFFHPLPFQLQVIAPIRLFGVAVIRVLHHSCKMHITLKKI